MRKTFFTLFILFGVAYVNAQTAENPFAKYGFKNVRAYSFSKGEFEEFHDNKAIVEIGSILFNTKTNQVVGYIDEDVDNEVDAATSAMTVDPLCEKYPWITPYAFCLNNPVKYVDSDGREPRIYVETKGFGHTFVTTGTGDNTTVYTYGRYGELGKNKSSARGATPTGEGILIRLTGDEAKSFIQDQITRNDAITFEFTKGSDEAVAKHFDNIFNSSDKIPTKGKYADNENARVIDTYNIFNNNCVTTSIDGVQSGSQQDLKLGGLKGPMAVGDVLNVQSGKKESNVIKIPQEEIKKELNLP